MNKGKIIIISGPSGSGKTTLFKKLLENNQLKKCLVRSISVTTRFPRPGEKNGRDYIFVSPKMFLFRRRRGHFLESEKVFGNYYGTPARNVFKLIDSGKNVLLCIDVNGAKHIQQKFPDAIEIFIKTSSKGILKQRLKKRGSEDKETVLLRLQRAEKELKESKKFDHIIINDYLPKAYRNLEKLIQKIVKNS